MSATTSQVWDAGAYAKHGAFVPALGGDVMALLAPKPGERVLDIGCGDGVLTEQIARAGADVTGFDADAGLLENAAARGITTRQGDAQALDYDAQFDAVFSNAALHWMPDHPAVHAGVYRALKPGGRFAAECGGFGNIAAMRTAIAAVAERHGVPPPPTQNYPTATRAQAELEAAGFRVETAVLVPRPTPLGTDEEGGMKAWLHTFRHGFFDNPDAGSVSMSDEICELLRPALCDERGHWYADYVRLRFLAFKD